MKAKAQIGSPQPPGRGSDGQPPGAGGATGRTLVNSWPAIDVGPLHVEKVVVRLLRADLDSPVPMSFSALTTRRTCLVELHAGGLVGVGESWVNYPGWAWAERVATLTEGVTPLLVGTDVSDVAAVHARLMTKLYLLGRQWGAPGPMWQAISGVDCAIWDLLGKAAGKSVAELLCASPRTRAPVYASGVGPDSVETFSERAAEGGFTALKVKVGFGAERDTSTLQRVRDVVGWGMRVFADANQAWTLDEARRMCDVLGDFGVEWCEEPLDGDDVSELEALHAQTQMPLATGENVYGLTAYQRCLSSPAISLIQPDVAKTGGITTAVNVIRMAKEVGTAVSPHCYSGALTLAGSIQVAAADEAVEWVELDIRENPLRTGVTSTPFSVENGCIRVPDGPGLGVELDETRLDYFGHRP